MMCYVSQWKCECDKWYYNCDVNYNMPCVIRWNVFMCNDVYVLYNDMCVCDEYWNIVVMHGCVKL